MMQQQVTIQNQLAQQNLYDVTSSGAKGKVAWHDCIIGLNKYSPGARDSHWAISVSKFGEGVTKLPAQPRLHSCVLEKVHAEQHNQMNLMKALSLTK